MEKNTITAQEVADQDNKPSLGEAVLNEIKAQAGYFADQLGLGDTPGEQAARRWLEAGWIAGVSQLLQQEAKDKYLRLVNQEKTARRKRQREAKYTILKNGSK